MLRSRIIAFCLVSLFISAIATAAAAEDLAVCSAVNNGLDRVTTKGGKSSRIASFSVQPFDCVASTDGKTVYVSFPSANGVSAIDVATGTNTSIATASIPEKMVLNAAGSRLYVATATDVLAIDTATNTVLPAESINLTFYGGGGYAIGISGGFLSVGTQTNVLLFDASASPPIFIGQRFIGARPQDLKFSSGGTKLYAILSNRVEALDTNGQPIQGGEQGNLHVLQVSTLAPLKVLGLGFQELESGVLFGSRYLYVTSLSGELFAADTTNDTLATPTPLVEPGQIWGIAAGADIYIGNQSLGLVSIVRTGRTPAGDRLDGDMTLPAGSMPYSITVLPAAKGKGGKP